MCRIKNDPNKFEFIKQERARLTKDGSVSIIIEDGEKGNTTFKVSILNNEKDSGSVTRVDFRDKHTVIVDIVNPNPQSSVTPDVPMKVGTYHGKELYMDYKLYKQYDDEDYREVNIEFGAAKESQTK